MLVAVVCTAILGLLVFLLGFNVSRVRGGVKLLHGHPADPEDPLYKAVRAHSNTAEFAPMLAILFIYLGMTNPAMWIMWVIGITTFCRVLIVPGILVGSLDDANPMRFIGALGTYLGGLILVVATAMTVL